jgi:hypothetical protein
MVRGSRLKTKHMLYMLYSFCLLDVVLSSVMLSRGATELNPVGRFLWTKWGVGGLLGGKAVLLVLVSLADDEPWYRKAIGLCTIVQILVVSLTIVVHVS